MLKQRLITGVTLAALIAVAILSLPTPFLGLLFLVFIGLATWEWVVLLALSPRWRWTYLGAVLVLALVGWGLRHHSGFILGVLIICTLGWCYALAWLIRYSRQIGRQDPPWCWWVAGLLMLPLPWLVIVHLHGSPIFGPGYVLFVLPLIWVADSGAYFVGRRFGRRKLAPHVSPGKTWEGVAGALLFSLVYALLGAWLLAVDRWLGFVLICIITVGFSIIGDLFESMAKRQHNVKDSGSLLPGHGGVLDRIDSLLAAVPLFALGVQLLASNAG